LADDQVTLVKEANDIVDVINEYVPLRKQGRTFKGLCPFHNDHHPSMTVDASRQTFSCFVCQIFGDVYEFVMRKERMDFREALELLAKRANITLRRGKGPAGPNKSKMYEVVKWAEQQYHDCLLHSPLAEPARKYLEERHLNSETIKRYGLGYAPASWDWLVTRARKAGWPEDLLAEVALVRRRENDNSSYDFFRDRVLFPIRDVRSRTIAFGGRILPSTSPTEPGPKYYNSSDTPLFTKSANLYGLDQARPAGEKEGFLAVVEGYTDVLMAHQLGVLPVVATLGTALNDRHISHLRKFVPKVVLVFDADAGGSTGVDRALELFISQEVELAIATLPEGLDPCDLLVKSGAEPFKAVLINAVDALDFKLARVLTAEAMASVEGRRRAIDEVLRILALLPETPSQASAMKRELAVSRMAHRAGINEATLWKRLAELRQERKPKSAAKPDEIPAETGSRAEPLERELLEVLLAEPGLVARARREVDAAMMRHAGARKVLEELYALLEEGKTPGVDQLRARLLDSPGLVERVAAAQAAGLKATDRKAWLEAILERFRQREQAAQRDAVRNQLKNVANHEPPPVELLRQLQSQPSRNRETADQNQRSGIRGQEPGVRSQESGVRSQESGVRPPVAVGLMPDS
jgi:DNA primase